LSYDPDGTIASYYWDFGDGTNGTGVAPVHKYSTYRWNGTAYLPFTVNLTVTDNSGMTNSTSGKVVIWIAGDANGDGKVNILDAALVGLKWNSNPTDPCADLNNDGKVNILDASIIGLNWGKSAQILT
jgi:PKD repeat protein